MTPTNYRTLHPLPTRPYNYNLPDFTPTTYQTLHPLSAVHALPTGLYTHHCTLITHRTRLPILQLLTPYPSGTQPPTFHHLDHTHFSHKTLDPILIRRPYTITILSTSNPVSFLFTVREHYSTFTFPPLIHDSSDNDNLIS